MVLYKQLIFLSSDKCDFESSAGHCSFFLPGVITLPDSTGARSADQKTHRFSVTVKDAIIPHSWYNVVAKNRILEVTYDGIVGQTIALPLGNYPIDSLVDFVNERLLNGFRVSYADATNKLTITNEGIAPPPTLAISEGTTCSKILGLQIGQAGAYLIEAAGVVNLLRTNAVYIHSSLFTRNRDNIRRLQSNVLGRVPVTECVGEYLVYRGDHEQLSLVPYMSYITLSITDSEGDALDLNGAPWSVCLEINVLS